MIRLRTQLRELKRSPEGSRAIGFGVRVGYWPCLFAPYAQATFLFWQFDIWYGLPSYKAALECRA